jgi:hypothetical protein
MKAWGPGGLRPGLAGPQAPTNPSRPCRARRRTDRGEETKPAQRSVDPLTSSGAPGPPEAQPMAATISRTLLTTEARKWRYSSRPRPPRTRSLRTERSATPHSRGTPGAGVPSSAPALDQMRRDDLRARSCADFDRRAAACGMSPLGKPRPPGETDPGCATSPESDLPRRQESPGPREVLTSTTSGWPEEDSAPVT